VSVHLQGVGPIATDPGGPALQHATQCSEQRAGDEVCARIGPAGDADHASWFAVTRAWHGSNPVAPDIDQIYADII